jgi:phosphatidylserine synthase
LPSDQYWVFAGSLAFDPMSLVPRWRFMTDEAKALTKRTAVTAGVVLLVLLVFRALLPWVLLAVVGWWIWKAVRK